MKALPASRRGFLFLLLTRGSRPRLFLVIGGFRCGDDVAAGEPAVEIDVRAAPRTEWHEFGMRGLAADCAALGILRIGHKRQIIRMNARSRWRRAPHMALSHPNRTGKPSPESRVVVS